MVLSFRALVNKTNHKCSTWPKATHLILNGAQVFLKQYQQWVIELHKKVEKIK